MLLKALCTRQILLFLPPPSFVAVVCITSRRDGVPPQHLYVNALYFSSASPWGWVTLGV